VSDVVIRTASAADARSIAEVHVRSWQAAYRGIVPDESLDGLSVGERERVWRSLLDSLEERRSTLVAEADARVVGFAAFGQSRDPDEPLNVGELYAIYLAPEWFSSGTGRRLLAAAVDGLARRFSEATLWVLAENTRATRFYEIAGWRADGTEKPVEGGAAAGLTEVRYRFQLPVGLAPVQE